MEYTGVISSGIPAMDEALQGLRLGDNVVLQVDVLDDYKYFVDPFITKSIADGRKCVYLRFAPHAPVLEANESIEVIGLDPSLGFDSFSGEVHRIIEERGVRVFYVFDNLSALVEEWATDESLANFFQVTCPFLFELDTVTYFALTRGSHAHNAVARIRDTTQVLIDVYRVDEGMYVHPLKVWDRYSPSMFLPHLVSDERWEPVFHSGQAARVTGAARPNPISGGSESIAPWESVYGRLIQYRSSGEDISEARPEIEALKQEFTRMLIGNQPDFNCLADEYFTLDDLFSIRDRLIGTGRIGGKAAGMLLARRILLVKGEETGVDFARVLERHDSFFIGSDVFFTFLVNNDLFRLRLRMTRSSHISRTEFAEVEERFLAGKFSHSIMEQFRSMLDYFGQAPIIARSSSLLEDSFGNAFAGKYHSEFCANQGTPDERLDAFMRAIKLVYASALNPDALSYRRNRGLGERDEQMAILVQRVSGMPYAQYFFPTMAGVAFSRNLYAWSDRIDPNQGLIRLVFGLGTRAVDRVGSDYPRMIAISNPQLRPETGMKVAKYSQRKVDVIDLASNKLVTVLLQDVLADRGYPNLHLLVSVKTHDYLTDPITSHLDGPPANYVLTFNNLIRRTNLVQLLGIMMDTLDKSYGHAVDVEFTAYVDSDEHVRINLLQCRPLFLPGSTGPVSVPVGIPREQVLFRSDRMISGGIVSDIRYILYIDPRAYAAFQPIERKKTLGRIVGRINEHPLVSEGRVLMMGPGRWGSSNIDLGVNVGYADIDSASVLVEIAREESGQLPEVSYGTHFFQDLVEAQIIYLPLNPDDPEAEFNSSFFEFSHNALPDLLPDDAEFERVVRLIDVPAVTRGSHAHVVADPQAREAICFLA